MDRYSYALTFVATLFVSGCVNIHDDSNCEIEAQDMVILQSRALEFLKAKGQDTRCEEFDDRAYFSKKHGCALYGNSTNGARNPLTGVACPQYLDGGYVILFDVDDLQPKEMLLFRY